MAPHLYEEESPYPGREQQAQFEAQFEGAELEVVRSRPNGRLRWPTIHVPASQAKKKRQSMLNRLHKRRHSDQTAGSNDTANEDGGDGSVHEAQDGPGRRTVYFNLPLPPSARDEEGHPISHYPRNKIRTAKYTPLSFIPKNLWFQFHNIANVYFFFIIILQV